MAVLIIFSMNKDVDLVTKNYYQKELQYQKQIDKEKKTEYLNKDVDVSVENEYVVISFPDSTSISGELNFYRPSDSKLDFKLSIRLNGSNKQLIEKKKYVRGFWRLKIHWEQSGHEFYTEKSFIVQ